MCCRWGLIASQDKHKGSPGQQGGSCQIGVTEGYSLPYFPLVCHKVLWIMDTFILQSNISQARTAKICGPILVKQIEVCMNFSHNSAVS